MNQVSKGKNNKKYQNKKVTKKAVKNTASLQADKHSSKFIKKFILFVFIVGIAIAFIALSGVFNVKDIVVEGNQHISTDQIISFSRNNYE